MCGCACVCVCASVRARAEMRFAMSRFMLCPAARDGTHANGCRCAMAYWSCMWTHVLASASAVVDAIAFNVRWTGRSVPRTRAQMQRVCSFCLWVQRCVVCVWVLRARYGHAIPCVAALCPTLECVCSARGRPAAARIGATEYCNCVAKLQCLELITTPVRSRGRRGAVDA